jgi:hypothetical protein
MLLVKTELYVVNNIKKKYYGNLCERVEWIKLDLVSKGGLF